MHKHCPEAVVHVLCLTDACYATLQKLNYSYLILYRLSELEEADQEMAATQNSRSLIEYYFTMTPCWPFYLLRYKNIDEVTYLDADMMFFTSPEVLFAEAKDADTIITPHRFSERLGHLEEFGIYNVSWLTFKNTPNGMRCLEWYREVCLEWCHDRVDGDRFADQKYLDAFPKLFDGVHVLAHEGAGLAPWNIENSVISGKSGIVFVGNKPLVFFHAQAFKRIWGPFYSSGCMVYASILTTATKRLIFTPYVSAFKNAESKARAVSAYTPDINVRTVQHKGFRQTYKLVKKEFKKSSLIIKF